MRQKFDPDFDLAAIPPRRRRQFVQHRFKYTRRVASPQILNDFNGYQTLFGLLGNASRYRFTYRFDTLNTLARDVLSSDRRLEFVEMYALDLLQHWHLDDEAAMQDALRKTDAFVARLRDGCAERGITLAVLSDHGQELVTSTVPLREVLHASGASASEYSYFCELGSARFWFHTDRARRLLVDALQKIDDCTLLDYRAMHQFDVCFPDAEFGEYYLIADAGAVFFPHDFYQPLANLYLGLFGQSQRKRMRNPVHRGNHGYLPDNPSEQGFLVLADTELPVVRQDMSLIDFAPTVLTCLGEPVPAHMTGRSITPAL